MTAAEIAFGSIADLLDCKRARPKVGLCRAMITSSELGEPTIDHQLRSEHIAGCVAGEEQYRRSNFVGVSKASNRNDAVSHDWLDRLVGKRYHSVCSALRTWVVEFYPRADLGIDNPRITGVVKPAEPSSP